MDVGIKLLHVASPGEEAECKAHLQTVHRHEIPNLSKDHGQEASPEKLSSLQLEQYLIRLPTEEDDEAFDDCKGSILHVYSQNEFHKCISPVKDPTRERRSGPKPKEHKAERKQKKKQRHEASLGQDDHNEDSFYMHRPYLAFHIPPRVLYHGNTKHAKPVVLIHAGPFWRWYKLQLGPSLSHDVVDPRGVVSWRHNGGNRKSLKTNDHLLKGYKVRGWRLWGEHGKHYVQMVKKNRLDGDGPDPDVLVKNDKERGPAQADEVVYLRWTNPLSRHTRRYQFRYAGIDFIWKGTGTVKESKRCGLMLRFNHLKLVANLPLDSNNKDEISEEKAEVCLCKYTSSVNAEKNGKLEIYHESVLRLALEHMPTLFVADTSDNQKDDSERSIEQSESDQMTKLKRSALYHVIIATAMCMLMSEKEKRHTLLALLEHAGEGGG